MKCRLPEWQFDCSIAAGAMKRNGSDGHCHSFSFVAVVLFACLLVNFGQTLPKYSHWRHFVSKWRCPCDLFAAFSQIIHREPGASTKREKFEVFFSRSSKRMLGSGDVFGPLRAKGSLAASAVAFFHKQLNAYLTKTYLLLFAYTLSFPSLSLAT